jgi:cobalt-zinc-cadmium efflux system protein
VDTARRTRIDLNLRGAWMHVMGDALGSVRRFWRALCMALFGWYAADALFSVVISLLIIWGSMRLIRESTNVLLEGTPRTSIWRRWKMRSSQRRR